MIHRPSPPARPAWMGLWLACWLAVLLAGLQGCASGNPASGDRQTDPVTASDEPEARKRARIRLELAAGYFEQGKTEIALDEVKQALVADPGFADAFNLRALIYMRLSDMRQAEDSFRRAVALNPRDANTLHNYGWMLCQLNRYDEANRAYETALTDPLYGSRGKTLMAQGICQARSGRMADAERTLTRSYELDPANPVTGYNLANLLYQRGELVRAQFYIRRLNNSELANAESLWLGVRVERKLGDTEAAQQLSGQLRRRFAGSAQAQLLEKGRFDD